jgi:hypothetical protein
MPTPHLPRLASPVSTGLRQTCVHASRRVGHWAVLGATVALLMPLEIWSLRRARRRLRTLLNLPR